MDGMDDKDFNDMLRLWQEVFGDDEAYVRDYLLSWRQRGNSFVRRMDGSIVSTADVHGFSCDGIDVSYIFGVMTDKRYRGRGLASSIVVEILRWLGNGNGYLAMLVAGSDTLAEWYRGFGFSRRFSGPVSLLSDDGSFDFGTGCLECNLPQYRIVDVAAYLTVYSERVDSSDFSVCVTDSVIESNNGVFAVGKGKAERLSTGSGTCVTVSQLADLYPLDLRFFSYRG